MTDYTWITEGVTEEDSVPVSLERIDPITKEISHAVIANNKLDEFFRDDNGNIKGIVPDRYVSQYKNYLKRSNTK